MSNFGSLENGNFYSLKRIVVYLEDPQSTFSALLCIKTNKKVQTFYQKWKFLWSNKACFLSKRTSSHIFRANLHKDKQKNFNFFLPKSCVNPFEKCPVSEL